MPHLRDGDERCALPVGTYTLGGNGADALPITRLESCPPVATIVVSADEAPTIQRLTARVVVQLDRVPLGIAAKPLHDGAVIEFADCSLVFIAADDSLAGIVPSGRGPSASEPWTGARIVNVRTGESITLGRERAVIGRDESCSLVVRAMRVSRRHFSVARVEGGYLLRDESSNGTLVNGTRIVGTYLLGHGDVMRLDEEELRFEIEGVSAAQPASEAAPTALLDVSSLRAEYASADRRELPPPAANLEVVRGHFAGATFAIDRPVCAIGRGPQSDVRIRDDSVSMNHASLLRKGTSWFVVDLRSANGTFVDGSRVAGERELVTGSRLRIGAVELTFRALDFGEAPVEQKPRRSLMRRLSTAVRQVAAGRQGA